MGATHNYTGAKGFRMRVEITEDKLIRGLMAQDPIHCSKKFDCKVNIFFIHSFVLPEMQYNSLVPLLIYLV